MWIKCVQALLYVFCERWVLLDAIKGGIRSFFVIFFSCNCFASLFKNPLHCVCMCFSFWEPDSAQQQLFCVAVPINAVFSSRVFCVSHTQPPRPGSCSDLPEFADTARVYNAYHRYQLGQSATVDGGLAQC